jgi:hypothetical protein
MNLLGTICCLFAGRCAGEEPKRGEAAVPKGDLGQAEAELEKTSKEQLSHMEGGETGVLTSRFRFRRADHVGTSAGSDASHQALNSLLTSARCQQRRRWPRQQRQQTST